MTRIDRARIGFLIAIVGAIGVESEKPYVATLKDEVWTVVGTFHCPVAGHCVGGVALAEISKQDGAILRVIHGL